MCSVSFGVSKLHTQGAPRKSMHCPNTDPCGKIESGFTFLSAIHFRCTVRTACSASIAGTSKGGIRSNIICVVDVE